MEPYEGLIREVQGVMVVSRDFNEITRLNEKKGGRLKPYNQMKNFQDVLDECGLMDLGFVGSKFTWFKNFADGIQCGRGWIR